MRLQNAMSMKTYREDNSATFASSTANLSRNSNPLQTKKQSYRFADTEFCSSRAKLCQP